ncbi:hypothetical protein LRS12_16005 [Sphingomonas sp. J344]|nr:hypothetical protein [Sphingomonas sp. J344]MCR5872078.1 hypothetical protein [Sphingomonas sp. J344]
MSVALTRRECRFRRNALGFWADRQRGKALDLHQTLDRGLNSARFLPFFRVVAATPYRFGEPQAGLFDVGLHPPAKRRRAHHRHRAAAPARACRVLEPAQRHVRVFRYAGAVEIRLSERHSRAVITAMHRPAQQADRFLRIGFGTVAGQVHPREQHGIGKACRRRALHPFERLRSVTLRRSCQFRFGKLQIALVIERQAQCRIALPLR